MNDLSINMPNAVVFNISASIEGTNVILSLLSEDRADQADGTSSWQIEEIYTYDSPEVHFLNTSEAKIEVLSSPNWSVDFLDQVDALTPMRDKMEAQPEGRPIILVGSLTNILLLVQNLDRENVIAFPISVSGDFRDPNSLETGLLHAQYRQFKAIFAGQASVKNALDLELSRWPDEELDDLPDVYSYDPQIVAALSDYFAAPLLLSKNPELHDARQIIQQKCPKIRAGAYWILWLSSDPIYEMEGNRPGLDLTANRVVDAFRLQVDRMRQVTDVMIDAQVDTQRDRLLSAVLQPNTLAFETAPDSSDKLKGWVDRLGSMPDAFEFIRIDQAYVDFGLSQFFHTLDPAFLVEAVRACSLVVVDPTCGTIPFLQTSLALAAQTPVCAVGPDLPSFAAIPDLGHLVRPMASEVLGGISPTLFRESKHYFQILAKTIFYQDQQPFDYDLCRTSMRRFTNRPDCHLATIFDQYLNRYFSGLCGPMDWAVNHRLSGIVSQGESPDAIQTVIDRCRLDYIRFATPRREEDDELAILSFNELVFLVLAIISLPTGTPVAICGSDCLEDQQAIAQMISGMVDNVVTVIDSNDLASARAVIDLGIDASAEISEPLGRLSQSYVMYIRVGIRNPILSWEEGNELAPLPFLPFTQPLVDQDVRCFDHVFFTENGILHAQREFVDESFETLIQNQLILGSEIDWFLPHKMRPCYEYLTFDQFWDTLSHAASELTAEPIDLPSLGHGFLRAICDGLKNVVDLDDDELTINVVGCSGYDLGICVYLLALVGRLGLDNPINIAFNPEAPSEDRAIYRFQAEHAYGTLSPNPIRFDTFKFVIEEVQRFFAPSANVQLIQLPIEDVASWLVLSPAGMIVNCAYRDQDMIDMAAYQLCWGGVYLCGEKPETFEAPLSLRPGRMKPEQANRWTTVLQPRMRYQNMDFECLFEKQAPDLKALVVVPTQDDLKRLPFMVRQRAVCISTQSRDYAQLCQDHGRDRFIALEPGFYAQKPEGFFWIDAMLDRNLESLGIDIVSAFNPVLGHTSIALDPSLSMVPVLGLWGMKAEAYQNAANPVPKTLTPKDQWFPRLVLGVQTRPNADADADERAELESQCTDVENILEPVVTEYYQNRDRLSFWETMLVESMLSRRATVVAPTSMVKAIPGEVITSYQPFLSRHLDQTGLERWAQGVCRSGEGMQSLLYYPYNAHRVDSLLNARTVYTDRDRLFEDYRGLFELDQVLCRVFMDSQHYSSQTVAQMWQQDHLTFRRVAGMFGQISKILTSSSLLCDQIKPSDYLTALPSYWESIDRFVAQRSNVFRWMCNSVYESSLYPLLSMPTERVAPVLPDVVERRARIKNVLALAQGYFAEPRLLPEYRFELPPHEIRILVLASATDFDSLSLGMLETLRLVPERINALRQEIGLDPVAVQFDFELFCAGGPHPHFEFEEPDAITPTIVEMMPDPVAVIHQKVRDYRDRNYLAALFLGDDRGFWPLLPLSRFQVASQHFYLYPTTQFPTCSRVNTSLIVPCLNPQLRSVKKDFDYPEKLLVLKGQPPIAMPNAFAGLDPKPFNTKSLNQFSRYSALTRSKLVVTVVSACQVSESLMEDWMTLIRNREDGINLALFILVSGNDEYMGIETVIEDFQRKVEQMCDSQFRMPAFIQIVTSGHYFSPAALGDFLATPEPAYYLDNGIATCPLGVLAAAYSGIPILSWGGKGLHQSFGKDINSALYRTVQNYEDISQLMEAITEEAVPPHISENLRNLAHTSLFGKDAATEYAQAIARWLGLYFQHEVIDTQPVASQENSG